MTKLIKLMALSLVITGCEPLPLDIQGTVTSVRQIGKQMTEYFVKTDNPTIPYYIIKINKASLEVGSKITIEFPEQSISAY
ncbi:MAG: hypothetical protein FJX03_07990 [Alphaproteobacteria bacterium]|nr:hypothetical protein [Alphaproteobacteria bacterium]